MPLASTVVMDEHTREIDYGDTTLTQNTRGAYPLHHIPNAKNPAITGHPSNVILLTFDATGTLPLVSKLNREQVRQRLRRPQNACPSLAAWLTSLLPPLLTRLFR